MPIKVLARRGKNSQVQKIRGGSAHHRVSDAHKVGRPLAAVEGRSDVHWVGNSREVKCSRIKGKCHQDCSVHSDTLAKL